MTPAAPIAGWGRTAYAEVRQLLAIPGAKPLAVVMLLPFTGIYQSMVASGALDSLTGSVGVGAVVFGGPAAVSIVFAKLATDRVRGLKLVCLVGAVQLPTAAVSGAVATASRNVLWVEGFAVLTALVLWVIAFDIINDSTPSWVPSLLAIGAVLTGVMLLDIAASLAAGEVTVIWPGDGVVAWTWTVLTTERVVIGRSVVAALSGLSLVALSVVFRPVLLNYVDLRRFKMGSAIALCLIGLDLTGVVADAPILTIVVVSLGLAVDAESAGREL